MDRGGKKKQSVSEAFFFGVRLGVGGQDRGQARGVVGISHKAYILDES